MEGKDIIVKLGKIVLPAGVKHPSDPGFRLTEETLPVYKQVYNYLLNPDLSLKAGILPSKGLLFCGSVGTGKTICMRVIQQMALWISGLENREMCIVHVNDFLKAFKVNEAEAFDFYGYNKKMEMCIDELGWEALQRHYYGNDTSSIVASWIMERNKLFVETGIRTHFTTNLFVEEKGEKVDLMKLYGLRIIDRLREQSNLINWDGVSLRA